MQKERVIIVGSITCIGNASPHLWGHAHFPLTFYVPVTPRPTFSRPLQFKIVWTKNVGQGVTKFGGTMAGQEKLPNNRPTPPFPSTAATMVDIRP